LASYPGIQAEALLRGDWTRPRGRQTLRSEMPESDDDEDSQPYSKSGRQYGASKVVSAWSTPVRSKPSPRPTPTQDPVIRSMCEVDALLEREKRPLQGIFSHYATQENRRFSSLAIDSVTMSGDALAKLALEFRIIPDLCSQLNFQVC
jgi:hypothetical protein